jgi:hypothetical protein
MNLTRLLYLLSLAVFVAGCNSGKVSSPTKSAEVPVAAQADEILASALYQLKPNNFGLNSSVEKPVSLLNSWRFKQVEQHGASDEPSPVNAPAGWIAESDVERLAQPKFDLADAAHIRDAMLFHTIAGYLSDRARNEVQRAAVVVDYVCRNVSLWKDDEIEVAVPPFMIIQMGRGTADDRAWVCACILRQLRQDAVIVRAKSDAKETGDKWLLGICVEGKVYLFDMRLGLPITQGDDPAIATLDEIVLHPEWLQQMSVKGDYRLTVDDLREPSISVMSDPLFWCRRMRNIEGVLPAKDVCVLYDPLLGEGKQKGALGRISETNHWPVENLKLWQYPRQQVQASQKPSKEAQQELHRLLLPLSVPIPVKVGQDGKATVGNPENKLQRIRVDQLLGKFTEAITSYNSIRHLVRDPAPPEIQRLNRMAAEDAIYWTAVCKFEVGEFDSAMELLTELQKSFDRNGNWYFPARSLVAQCRIELGQIPEAIAALERSSTDDPYQSANAIRLKRLKARVPNRNAN